MSSPLSRDLGQTISLLERFTGVALTGTVASIEASVQGLTAEDFASFLPQTGIRSDVLAAAAEMKRLAGQINVTIHALGILLCLPHVLEKGEQVSYVSLGAGNTGRKFDLETDRRVAEFKFIHWQGGAETIRQNSLFKDFFLLSEADTNKSKYLYVLGTKHPLKFFNGRRALQSVLSKDNKIRTLFYSRFGERFSTVREYYELHGARVRIEDVSPWLPELARRVLSEDVEEMTP
jgi:hypothetical protein